MTQDKVLFVDDEDNVVSALKRQFRKQFDVHTALGGSRALQLMASEGPFAVIVSDMQMPVMNGVEFFKEARKMAPDSVRLMLTGNADQKTAMAAVNDGCVFSFLTKPCPPEVMVNTIRRAIEQYHLVTAERELLEGTLSGAVKLLTEMLSMVAPDIFSRTHAVREAAARLGSAMKLENTWDLDIAAMLGSLAFMTLPPETLARMRAGQELTIEERSIVGRLPETGRNLVNNIPRLERVANIIFYQQKHYDGSGFPDDARAGADIPLESRILKVLGDLEAAKARGIAPNPALTQMADNKGVYDPVILQAVAGMQGTEDTSSAASSLAEVTLSGLRPGHVLISNITTIDGRLLFAAGHTITPAILERLLNYHQVSRIKEPIQVLVENP